MNKQRKNTSKAKSGISKKESSYKKYTSLLIVLFIVIITALLYFNSISNNFSSWDDDGYILSNPYLSDFSLTGIGDIFSHIYKANYHPFTTLSWAIEYHFFGADPKPFHTFNLLLHLLNVILVFIFIKKLTGKTIVSGITAFLFAIHPMHVESVSWISERKDVLYTVFFLLALICYLKYIKENFKIKYLIYSELFFIFSLFSKSAAVILPLVLLLIDYYSQRKFTKKLILEKIPFLILAILFGLIALHSQSVVIEAKDTPVFSFINRIFLANFVSLLYVFKMFVPIGLSAFHPYPVESLHNLPILYYVAPLLTFLLIFLIIKSGKLKRELVFGTVFFLVSIILIIQLIPVGKAFFSERYSYVSYIGLSFIIGYLFQWIQEKNIIIGQSVKNIIIFFFACFSIWLMILTRQGNYVWENDSELWTNQITNYPNDAYGYYALGFTKSIESNYNDAVIYYNNAIRIKPGYYDALVNRGLSLIKLKNFKGAISDFNQVITIKPDDYEAYNNRGNAKTKTGDSLGAINDFTLSLKFKPDYSPAYYNRGSLEMNLKNYEKAKLDFDKAIEIDTNYAEAYNNRGILKYFIEDYAGSIKDYSKAIFINPENSFAYKNRGLSKLKLHDTLSACDDWHIAYSLGLKSVHSQIEKYCNK
jgi:protein O-mannosyl-transferase